MFCVEKLFWPESSHSMLPDVVGLIVASPLLKLKVHLNLCVHVHRLAFEQVRLISPLLHRSNGGLS